MQRVRAPQVLHQGLCTARDCSTAVSRKKGESAERLKEHDLRCAEIRIVEQFLGFIRESCSWLACSPMACCSLPKPLLPGHCKSRHWLFLAGTRHAYHHREVMVIEPAEWRIYRVLLQLGTKGSSKEPSDLWNKHKSLCCELKDVKD